MEFSDSEIGMFAHKLLFTSPRYVRLPVLTGVFVFYCSKQYGMFSDVVLWTILGLGLRVQC